MVLLPSLFVEWNVTYHSVHGAIRESQHVFIEAGLQYSAARLKMPKNLNILEMGFGTGLNAFLTMIEAEKIKQRIYYTAIESHPLKEQEISTLNYCERLNRPDLKPLYYKLHSCEWEKEVCLTPYFSLFKCNQSLLEFKTGKLQHIIYFDAFAPAVQPELWTKDVFEKVYKMLLVNGVLVTYCSKGDVRRAMIKAGFNVEKIPGPPGKREMMRAWV